jgi:L-lactate dehydrogenase complex protein LldG
MSSRDTILAAIRANRPAGDHPLPDLPRYELDTDLPTLFATSLETMGGRLLASTPGTVLQTNYPDAATIVSNAPEIPGTRRIEPLTDPKDLAQIDVAILRASFAIAETGSVLFTDEDLVANALAYLAQHLLVLLDPTDLVATTGEAYNRPEFATHRYAVFHTGPSATADIEGVLIHGAQGVRSLSVLFHPRLNRAA